jgi:hypothetical protein
MKLFMMPHTVPNSPTKGRRRSDGSENAGATQHLPADTGLDPLEPRGDAFLDTFSVTPIRRSAQFAFDRRDQPRDLRARLARGLRDLAERARRLQHVMSAGEPAARGEELERLGEPDGPSQH